MLAIQQDITIQRRAANVIELYTPIAVHEKTIRLVVKDDYAIEGQRLIEKSFVPEGVSNGIAAVEQGPGTKIIITFLPADTWEKEKKTYYYSITAVDSDDADDFEVIFQGTLYLVLTVESQFDSTTVETHEYVNQAYDKIAIIDFAADGSAVKQIDQGFVIAITPTRQGAGAFRLVSDKAIFDADIRIIPESLDRSSLDNYYMFHQKITSTTQLEIFIRDFYSGAASDIPFSLELKRVRQ